MFKLVYQLLCWIWQKAAGINDRLFRGNGDFSGWMSQEEAGFEERQGNEYQPSTDALVKVLKKFPISSEDSIIDIGCGKGKAMYLMSRLPFGKIRGFDLSRQLADIANQNFEKTGVRQCEAFQADATVFDDYDEFNYFYVFNSFPLEVFEVMMGHVLESIKRKPRNCRFIYLNPVCHDYMVNHTPFRLVYEKKSMIDWFTYYCYEYTIS